MIEIQFYRTKSGHCPVEKVIDSLSGKQAQKVTWVLRLIKEVDLVPAKYLKKLVNIDDIWEIRVQAGNNIFRLLGFFDDEQIVILNHAFQKKSQKTPTKEIKKSETRKKDYLERRLS